VLERWLRFPDAILTDYRIGARQTAHEVVAAVRRYTGEQTPALIVTGEELGRAALEIAGSLCPVIKKPLSAGELRRHLVAALGRDVPATAQARLNASPTRIYRDESADRGRPSGDAERDRICLRTRRHDGFVEALTSTKVGRRRRYPRSQCSI
jgi:hypothetical protein